MPRVNSFEVEITTGAQGMPGPVKFDFNGHTMDCLLYTSRCV